jgi:GrpB-like predicted nucleotidyltransferase (UPF0157 family)
LTTLSRLFYRRGERGARTIHLHVVPADSLPARNELLLRDYLRAHPNHAHRYADLKRDLAVRCESGADYTKAQTELIQELTDRARSARGEPSVPVWEE